MLDQYHNHFELFDLQAGFAIDLDQLDRHYRKLQSEVHPDKFAAASPAERLRSMQLATHVNEAYQTLKSPITRARYLLHLHNVDTLEETNTAMPAAFLMQQMEWREAIEEASDARDIDALDRLLHELRHEGATLEQKLHATIDQQPDFAQAAETVRKLRFLDKVRVEIEQAIEALEN
jgi:molecular chaperone HscB